MNVRIASNWESIASWIGRMICGLSGHQLLLNAEAGRLSLKCMSCRYETPGWIIKEQRDQARTYQPGPSALVHQRAQG